MKKLLLILLFVPMLLVAQNKLSPYTRVFLDERANAQTEAQKMTVKKQFAVRSVEESEEEYISGFLLIESGYDTDELEAMGVRINTNLGTILTADIPLSQLDAIMSLDYVERFEMGTPATPTMNKARALANVDAVHSGVDGLPKGYTGKNVVVGIVDVGFQYDHINFYTKDKKNSRVKYVWNQSINNDKKNPTLYPQGFTYGQEYKTEKEILNAQHDRGDDSKGTPQGSHGTHVAGMATGSTSRNYGGVAPDAEIILVSVDRENAAGVLDGVKYCFDKAGDKPCVVNVSWGSHIGPHDGTSLFDLACDSLLGEKRILVGSAGNEGGDSIHCSKSLLSSTDTLKTIIQQNQNLITETDKRIRIDIWGDTAQDYQLQLCIFDNKGNVVEESGIITPRSSNANFSFSTGGKRTITCKTDWYPFNNKGNILVSSDDATIDEGYFLGFKIMSDKAGTVNAWINGTWQFAPNQPEGFTVGDNWSSIGELGGTGNRIISVGSFNSTSTVENGKVGVLSNYSSKGPTADGRMKPEVIAAGCQIISSVNGYDKTSTIKETFGNKEYYYDKMQGTSMSSPFVAGVIALWMENAPFLTPEQAKEVLKKTCTTDANVGSNPDEVGYGKIDALAGLIETFNFSSLEEIEASDAQLICYPNPVVDQLKLFFPKTDKNVTISIWNASGQLVEIRQIDKVANLQEETINFSAMPSGLYFVCVAGSKTNETFKIQK